MAKGMTSKCLEKECGALSLRRGHSREMGWGGDPLPTCVQQPGLLFFNSPGDTVLTTEDPDFSSM